ncbi:hypothetical protein Misp01_10760 [Microtetraspora sp. NBRC 13810]|uniref:hypothetical protein n=1 Tax=Microtetraspora sp. NBRC 13810 TaxID=3030990 RepID=UPI0024A043D1|nr:hypothetical protein [Microtetraspora sp. NBRC 13810]GLW05946.1 hypothetical protein Misp01_10760 [Microtetraspora sp. NBRC 13810]
MKRNGRSSEHDARRETPPRPGSGTRAAHPPWPEAGAMDELRLLDASRRRFLTGAVPAAGAGLISTAAHGSGLAALNDQAMFVLHVDERVLRAAPLLADVIADIESSGVAAVGDRLSGRLRWSVWNDPEVPLAKLTLTLTEPVAFQVDLLLECRPYAPFLWLAARGGHLAIATLDRSAATDVRTLATDLNRCLILDAPRSTALLALIDKMGWPKPRPVA